MACLRPGSSYHPSKASHRPPRRRRRSIFWDYFSPAWSAKAQAYLSGCGNFFVFGENSGFPAKASGVTVFLNAIGATTAMSTCNSATGNAYQGSPIDLVSTLPGAAWLHTWAFGGIPLSVLNGSNYASATFSDTDGVVRSVAAGWNGSQMPGLGAASSLGRLFTLWDQSMLQWGDYEGNAAAKLKTDAFFTAVADLLGARSCSLSSPTVTPTATFTPAPTATPTPRMPLVKTVDRSVATLGDTLTYCVAWSNDSAVAQPMVITDALATALVFVGGAPAPLQSGQLLTWNLGMVAPGSSGQVCFGARVAGYP